MWYRQRARRHSAERRVIRAIILGDSSGEGLAGEARRRLVMRGVLGVGLKDRSAVRYPETRYSHSLFNSVQLNTSTSN